MPKKIWLSSPHLGQEELAFVHEAFDTNWIAPLGPNVNGFEQDLQTYNKIAHAAALSSGTAAIHLALRLLDIQADDYILCQSFTFCGSSNPIKYVGAQVVFIDSEEDTWNMSPALLEEAIQELAAKGIRPKAVIPVHLYGMPARMPEIQQICKQYEIPIIEDAAESLGSTLNGQYTGTFGRLGVYSFNGNKIITTSGGGALVSNDKQLIDKARFLATQARDEAPHYQHSEIGYNYRLSNVLAGIGRGQMQVLDERIRQRRANFSRYVQYFSHWNEKGFRIKWLTEPEGYFSNRWLSTFLIDASHNKGLDREKIRLGLYEADIDARPLWKPMHLQPIYKDALFYGDGTSEKLFDQGLCLPSSTNMSEQDWGRIFSSLDKIFQSY
jgi:dTDP-4-amino-4,6-dideoxygalactose transaminase